MFCNLQALHKFSYQRSVLLFRAEGFQRKKYFHSSRSFYTEKDMHDISLSGTIILCEYETDYFFQCIDS